MRIVLNVIVNGPKAFLNARHNGIHSTRRLCRKYSSKLDRVDDAANSTLPPYVDTRLKLWYRLKEKFDQESDAKSSRSIKVRLSNGTTKDALAWRSTPFDIVSKIDDKSASGAIVAKVNGVLWDLKRPLEADCTLEFVPFNDCDGRKVFWHSSAHVLGEALESLYGGLLCNGPPIENGFYYDMFTTGVVVNLT